MKTLTNVLQIAMLDADGSEIRKFTPSMIRPSLNWKSIERRIKPLVFLGLIGWGMFMWQHIYAMSQLPVIVRYF